MGGPKDLTSRANTPQSKDAIHGERPSFRRRKILIIPKLQLSLVMAALIVFILAAVIFFATVNVVFLKLREIGLSAGLTPESVFFTDLKSLEDATAMVYGITVLVGIVTLYIGGLKLSHRVAGPIYVLNRHIQQVTAGETFSDLRLRKDDFMQDVQASFNQLLKQYRELLEKSQS
jgi:methyl-accepting chemotaxis protein